PPGRLPRVIVQVQPGVYRDPLRIPPEKPCITLRGLDARTTVLTGNLSARMIGPDGQELGMYRTASVYVDADDFVAEEITFENTAGEGGQALALSLSGDRAIFRRCRFLGWQDTLFVTRGRSYFRDCYIEGHCDFIFGDGTAVFDRCEIHSLSANYVTAASTPPDQPFGLVFLNCRLTDDGRSKAYYLGRPWRPHAAVAFLHCELSANINPLGWDNWRNPENEKTARFREFRNYGPGARPALRVPWSRQLSEDEAADYSLANVLRGNDGWDPTTH
ncbi:MAG: pectinesterase family protein, partial [Nitrospira sp.]|nr:pectinesterase family protein [Nitrospira sp.]